MSAQLLNLVSSGGAALPCAQYQALNLRRPQKTPGRLFPPRNNCSLEKSLRTLASAGLKKPTVIGLRRLNAIHDMRVIGSLNARLGKSPRRALLPLFAAFSTKIENARQTSRAKCVKEGSMSKVPRDTVRQAIRLLRLEKSPQEIVAHFKGRFEWSEFEIGIAEEKERRRGYNQHRRYLSKTMQLGLGLGPEPSPSALADRECRARLRDHVSFSIRHFGDPLPGYSALDARSKQPRSRMSDPLAGLKYGRDRIVELDLPQ